jgi:thiamine phosphate synthase YjbQ (UPF0047 family)
MMLTQHLSSFTVQTPARGLVEITREVRALLAESGIRQGLLTLFDGGQLALGTWQGIYLWEHRSRGHARELVVHVLDEK